MRTMTHRTAAARTQPPLFTVPEAAWAARTSETFIHKEIDNKIVIAKSGHVRTRYLDKCDLSYFVVVRDFKRLFQTELRKRIYIEVRKAIEKNNNERDLSVAFVLRLDGVLEEINQRMEDIMKARASVNINPSVRGGMPVIGGTRIPVHVIGEMIRRGVTEMEIAEAYDLSCSQIESAVLYDQLHPRRGRPARDIEANMSDLGESSRIEIEELGEFPHSVVPTSR